MRKGEGRHETPDMVQITPGLGLVGDRWSQRGAGKDPDGYSAVTLMNATVAELLTAGRQPLDAPGDNLHVDLDISVEALPAGTRLRAGSAVLEVSAQPHTGCSTFSGKFGLDALKWVSTPEGRQRRLRGVNCAVISDGQGTRRRPDRGDRTPDPAGRADRGQRQRLTGTDATSTISVAVASAGPRHSHSIVAGGFELMS